MAAILMALPGAERLAVDLPGQLDCTFGQLLHRFPDGETCPRLSPAVAGRDVVLVGALERPDDKLMAL